MRDRRARNSSFEVSQFLPVTGDRCVGGGQEHAQLRSSQQGTLESQDPLRESGTIRHGKPKLAVASWYALFQIAHRLDICLGASTGSQSGWRLGMTCDAH